jgi:hypothetical protein
LSALILAFLAIDVYPRINESVPTSTATHAP